MFHDQGQRVWDPICRVLSSGLKTLAAEPSVICPTNPHHSPNRDRPSPPEWGSFLGLGFSVILSNDPEGHTICAPCSQPCQLMENQLFSFLTGVESSDSFSFLIASPDSWSSVNIPWSSMPCGDKCLLQLAVCASYYHFIGFMCLEGSILIWMCLFKSPAMVWLSHSIIVSSELSMPWQILKRDRLILVPGFRGFGSCSVGAVHWGVRQGRVSWW